MCGAGTAVFESKLGINRAACMYLSTFLVEIHGLHISELKMYKPQPRGKPFPPPIPTQASLMRDDCNSNFGVKRERWGELEHCEKLHDVV